MRSERDRTPAARLLMAAVLAVFPAGARGAAGSGVVDLDTLLRAAQSDLPSLAAARLRAEGAAREESARRALPDPRLGVGAANDGFDPSLGSSVDSFVEISWEQDVPAPGLRNAAASEARNLAAEMRSQAGVLQAEARERIIRMHAELWRLDRSLELQREAKDLLATLAGAARIRYESGEGIQEPVLRAQVEEQERAVDILHLERERRAAQYALAEAAGRPADELAGPAGPLPALDLPAADADVETAAEENSAEIAAALAGVASRESALALARAGRRPDWMWRASYQNRGGLDPVLTGGVGVALPLWRRAKQDAAVARASAELEAQRRELESVRLRVRTRARDALDEAHHSGVIADLYETVLVPQSRTLLDAARVAYESGQSELTQVLRDQERGLAARIGLADERAQQVQAAASLEAALGRLVVQAGAGAAAAIQGSKP